MLELQIGGGEFQTQRLPQLCIFLIFAQRIEKVKGQLWCVCHGMAIAIHVDVTMRAWIG